MNWMGALVETYDSCIRDPTTAHERVPLVPICHTTVQAQIDVRIDINGNFLGAEAVPKEDQTTIIPCTEESAGRTSAPVAHPLCDKIKYVAGDLREYKAEGQGRFATSHSLFTDNLKSWCDSDHSDPYVNAVLAYVLSGRVVRDLVNSGVVVLNGSGELASKEESPEAPLYSISKLSGDQDEAVIRWIVTGASEDSRVWENPGIRDSWVSYYTSCLDNEGLCYLTGEMTPLAQNHPSKIRNAGDKAKIISSNDKLGFSYRGRFEDATQAYGVGYIATQKMHSALRWLIGRQGYREGDLCIVSWTLDGDGVRSPVQDYSEFLEIDGDVAFTNEEAAKALNRMISGYNSRILNKKVCLMAMDSATTGRMSVTMFRTYLGEDFVQRLEDWHIRCAWIHTYVSIEDEGGKRRNITFVGAPSPRDIAKAAYGDRADQKIVSHAVQRILPCILEGMHVPRDIRDNAIRRATNPVSMELWEWKKTLSIACSLYKESEGGRYEMVLEKERRSRDYLYGRLLAVADLLEGAALKDAGESRQTTAMRLMQRFSEFPYSTWKDIELALVPYMSRLGPKANYYRSKISEIMDMFEGDDFRNNGKLSGEFLLAYHCQIEDHYRKKEDKEEKEE